MENIDEWELDLGTWQWKQLTKKEWRQFEFMRKDKGLNNLFWIRQALFSLEAGWKKKYKSELKNLTKELGFTPDLALIKELYLPDIEHKIVVSSRTNDTYIISVDGVRIRFNEGMHSVSMTIEGSLKDKFVEGIKKSILSKLQMLEGCKYIFVEMQRN